MLGQSVQESPTRARSICSVQPQTQVPLGFLKFAKSRDIKGGIINATIRRNASGKYFVSILCEEEMEALPTTDSVFGIDLGITDFAILSNGQKIDNNKFTSEMEKKLKREQRKLSRRALNAKKEVLTYRMLKTIKNKNTK